MSRTLDKVQFDQKQIARELAAIKSEASVQVDTLQRQIVRIDNILTRLQDLGTPVLRVTDSSAGGRALAEAKVADTAIYVALDKGLDFKVDDLVLHEDLMKGLASPANGHRNLQALWEKNLRPLCQPSPLADHDEALAIAENASATGLGLTTVHVARKTRGGALEPVAVHILRNNNSQETMIVGEKITPDLRRAFNKAGIHYVDRTLPKAEKKAAAVLAEVAGAGQDAFIGNRLMDAFTYRNDLEESRKAHPALKGASLAGAMVSRNVEPLHGKYVLKVK